MKVGDRVRVNTNYEDENLIGEIGTVTEVRGSVFGWPISVKPDNLDKRDGLAHWVFDPEELDILDENYPNEVPC